MAVQEMNGIEINGKSVNVRLVKIPGEHTPPPLSKNGNSTSVHHLEKMTNKEGTFASSTCRLPRARPRQPESEQDSEFPPLEQVSFLLDEKWPVCAVLLKCCCNGPAGQ